MELNTAQNLWEQQVRTQLKTQDIYEQLQTRVEGILIDPIYFEAPIELQRLPRLEDSSVLVANYHESLEGEVLAFRLDQNVEGLEEVSVYIQSKELCEHILSDNLRVFSLVEVFDPKTQEISTQLGKEFQAKGMERPLCIDISLFQNAGASLTQQLLFAVGKAKELIEVFGPDSLDQMLIKVAVGSNYFLEIAKLRALKLLFHQLGKEYDKEIWPYLYAEPSERNKSTFDEENNLIRSTLELSAAMIGGADAVFSTDYKLQESSDLSKEISFKQQVILAYESLINVFEDSMNGSYYVETLTRKLCEVSWEKFLELEDKGGYLESYSKGEIAKEIYLFATKEHEAFLKGETQLIGVNLYPKRDQVKSISELYNEAEIKPVRLSEVFES